MYNEPNEVAATVASVRSAIERAPSLTPAEFVIADDGSTVDVIESARRAAGDLPVRWARLEENGGRFAARATGLEAATGELVLFLDAGIIVTHDSLEFLEPRIADSKLVWNGDVTIDGGSNPFALFWKTTCALAFAIYLDNPRETSFGIDDFEPWPKGLGCFLAPRVLFRESFAAFDTAYADTRNANDDDPIIRHVARHARINIAPGFHFTYHPRRNVRSFVRHAFHRGGVFVDGHARRHSRFFPIAIAFFPVSASLFVLAAKKPVVVPAAAAVVAGAAGAAAASKRRPAPEVASIAALAPLYLLAHGLGMWRGLGLAAAGRLRSST